ncbi:hypothetical protein A5791_08500 [Mycobacterium sp. 852002-51163_SCH5372311]|uniref:Rv1893 family protein n=1 Tax=Mycobacterium sp. 852002-51163_SCH5372311 TaxID=1834097 RepID=UPI0007FE2B49|nr:hypothetical protein [Mycobacterium sp. 852002-51163_SCH5372311]OBF80427.1 hypothetical protein A5791_08500 [Mycobacterium sp. 852002-51163_SCH5372311]
MAIHPRDAVDAVRDVATHAVEKASDIVDNASHVIRGDVAGGVSGIVRDSIDIATYAAETAMDVIKGRKDEDDLDVG